MGLYRLLELPAVYRLSQALLAPGGDAALKRLYGRLLQDVPRGACLLDAGCGPSDRLEHPGLRSVGLDISFPYMRERARDGLSGVVASATSMPFDADAFDVVLNVGLLHHLADDQVVAAVREFRRVCRHGGRVIVLDAVMPRQPAKRPIAYAIRRFDRGTHVRSETAHRRLLDEAGEWRHERHTYTLNGLELVLSVDRC